MLNKPTTDKFLLITLIYSVPMSIGAYFLLTQRYFGLSEVIEIALFIPGGIMMISLWLLIAFNPEKLDRLFDMANIFRLPRYPKEKNARLRFIKYFAYFMTGITIGSLLLLIVVLSFKAREGVL